MRSLISPVRQQLQRRWPGLAVGALLALAAFSAAADVVRVERVGEVGVASTRGDLRQAAVRRGVGSGVLEVARELAGRPPEGEVGDLRAALGTDPFVYAERFRVLEDRGRVSADDSRENGGGGERYAVLVEVYVERDRVERRLREQRILGVAAPRRPFNPVSVEIRFLDSYADLEAVKAFLIDPGGAQSVVPREIARGLARLRVETRDSARDLASRILRLAPAELGLRRVQLEDGVVTIELK